MTGLPLQADITEDPEMTRETDTNKTNRYFRLSDKGDKLTQASFSRLISLTIVLLLNVTSSFAKDENPDYSNLFGGNKNVHPFINVDMNWSDNVFETEADKKNDMVIYTRPGIWFAIPGSDRQIIKIDSASQTPGGSTLTHFNDNDTIRYQAYLLYSPEIETYTHYTKHNDINHKAEGYLLYNSPIGLSVELLDQFTANHDTISANNYINAAVDNTNISSAKNQNYKNNYLGTTVSYHATDKLTVRADYSVYNVNYEHDADINDRVDQTVSAYVFYKILPKTSLFFQYSATDVDYSDKTDLYRSIDNKISRYLLGTRWDITNKTTGSFKLGYQNKTYAEKTDPITNTSYDAGKTNTLDMELNMNFAITGKSALSFTARNGLTETNQINAYYVRSDSVLAVYQQNLTGRITGFLSLYYNDETYGRLDRRDKTYDISPSIAYVYNNALKFNLAYTFENVRSSGEAASEDYKKNSVLLSATASM